MTVAVVLKNGVPSAPMPGQSWTEPVGKHAWQRPPQITDPQEAADDMWKRIMTKQHFVQIVALLKAGTPVTTLTISILMNAVMAGLFTMDIAMIIKDVIGAQLTAVAEKAKINYRFTVDNAQPGQADFEGIMAKQSQYKRNMATPEDNVPVPAEVAPSLAPTPQGGGGFMAPPPSQDQGVTPNV